MVALVRSPDFGSGMLLRRQADALVACGYAVDVICPGEPGQPAVERLGAITVRRVGADDGRQMSAAVVRGPRRRRSWSRCTSLVRGRRGRRAARGRTEWAIPRRTPILRAAWEAVR